MAVQSILALKGANVTTGSPTMTLAEVCTWLSEQRIGAIVMTDERGTLSGIISERDIVRVIATGGMAVLQEQAGRHMTTNVVTCTGRHNLNEVMEMMTRGRFRHLPVVEDGKLVGIVSIGDVVKHRMAEIEREADEIRNYIATA
ncbi:MAG TPA: CBS domain-containing protein [Methylomirabilota bacterium]|nr:CBS domain-containing protein [Methylomirabilota bacterium]